MEVNYQNWTRLKLEKQRYIPYFWSVKSFKDIVVNNTCLSLNESNLKSQRQSL